jgi:hypothetical protein
MKGSEIEQGLLGDCYLLCALATAVKDLQVADDLIDETYEDAGIYGVTFWADGRWRMVWVDAYVPCTSKELSLGSDRMMNGRSMNSTGRGRAVKRFRPLFAKMKDTKEIWTLLVEKAYAKYKGGYEAIVGGHPGEALSLITGGTTGYTLLANQSIGAQQAMLLPRPTADFVWLTLSSKLRASDCFVGAGSVRPSARNQEAQEKFLKGVVPGHAYTVMDVMELPEVVHSDEEQEAADDEEEEAEEGADGAASKEPQMKQIIKLRNPWYVRCLLCDTMRLQCRRARRRRRVLSCAPKLCPLPVYGMPWSPGATASGRGNGRTAARSGTRRLAVPWRRRSATAAGRTRTTELSGWSCKTLRCASRRLSGARLSRRRRRSSRRGGSQ